MARQSKEDRAVPEGRRKAVPTQGVDSLVGGGKAIPVNERTWQLELVFETAEKLARATDGGAGGEPTESGPREVPKSKRKDRTTTSATMEEVTRQLRQAFQNVSSNRGAPGPDRQSIEEVGQLLDSLLPRLERALLDGEYQPGNIRRVWIPKSGGRRGLGIPNVVDRVVAEAVRLVLEPEYEPTFHAQRHGFRPGRSCHTAIAEARKHLADGFEWVVDLDLEKFFDRVNHQRLMARLSKRVSDRRLLVLMGRMLKAKVVLPDGVVMSTWEGVPQGGPLSPLLSNIVLDELDTELERRGHRFVRYADDCNIYVRSERAGQRVMASVVQFIERRLRLKVNAAKSAVAKPEQRHFLGFSLRKRTEGVGVFLSGRSKERVFDRINELTPRNWGDSLRACIRRLNVFLRGWLGFFGICTDGNGATMQWLDEHIRRRLRAIQLSHWKRKRTIARNLIRHGVSKAAALRCTHGGRKSTWALSLTPSVMKALSKAYLAERGSLSLAEEWGKNVRSVVAPAQIEMALG
jgi:group II intron reverse transcriptase/maturase